MEGEMDRKVFISRQSGHFSSVNNMIKVIFAICTLIWRGSNYVSRQGKGINRRNGTKVLLLFYKL